MWCTVILGRTPRTTTTTTTTRTRTTTIHNKNNNNTKWQTTKIRMINNSTKRKKVTSIIISLLHRFVVRFFRSAYAYMVYIYRLEEDTNWNYTGGTVDFTPIFECRVCAPTIFSLPMKTLYLGLDSTRLDPNIEFKKKRMDIRIRTSENSDIREFGIEHNRIVKNKQRRRRRWRRRQIE